MQLTPATRIRLGPCVRILLRGDEALQFGLDATRSGVIETPLAVQLVPALESLRTPRPLHEALAALERCGMTSLAARSLIDELVSYRVITPERSPTVLLVGSGALIDALSTLLRSSGVVVRTPLGSEPLERTLSATDSAAADAPVAFVDDVRHPLGVARSLRESGRPALPVTMVDARVFIGPLAVGRPGPCLRCAHFYHVQRDAHWDCLTHELTGSTGPSDPATVAAGAAASAVILRRLCAVPGPPGVSAPPPRRGDLLIADPFGPEPLTRSRLPSHPRCKVCF